MTADLLTVSATRLAACLGLTPRRLNQLVAEGVLHRDGDVFDLEGSVRAYVAFLKADEDTKRERRALLRAQTAATKARALRHTGATLTRADVLRRLSDPIADLWNLRVVVSWHRARLLQDDRLPPGTVDRLCSELYGEITGLIAQARDRFEALFPPPSESEDDTSDDNEAGEAA